MHASGWLTRSGWCAAVLACSCGGHGPAAPSVVSVAGVYKLAVVRCGLQGESTPEVAMVFPCGSGTWTLSQTGDDVSGSTEGRCAPFNWTGTLTGKVVSDRIEVAALAYEDATTHSEIRTLSVGGTVCLDSTGFTGRLSGDYTSTPTFGSARGPVAACHGGQMPFRFSREP
jgi:hypothetical protein